MDGFQTNPLWKLEILQKLLLLKVFHVSYKNTELLFLWQWFLTLSGDKH